VILTGELGIFTNAARLAKLASLALEAGKGATPYGPSNFWTHICFTRT
jgi:hypothetical protein